MLPQLVAFGAMSALCWFGTRWLKQEFERVDGEMKRVERMLTKVRTAPQLRFDPMTGHYRLLK